MDGFQPAGPVLAIDHDGIFKDLLTTFFVEFLQLFFPRLVASIDPDSIEFLPQEVFTGLAAEGERLLVDILVKVRFKGDRADEPSAFFLIHIEHQSTAPADFLERFFRYYLAVWNKYGLPVYPIVVYSHDAPRRKQPNVLRKGFEDGEVLRFTSRVVQLNRLPWRRFVRSRNPLASALMAKMKVAPRDRPKVKLECLRLMVTLQADPRRMRLIGAFVDSYLRLNAEEQARFDRSLERAKLKPEQKETIVEYTTSWKEEGIAIGLQQGLQQGLQRGRDELRAVLLDILATRFGSVPASLTERVRRIESIEGLRELTHRALIVASLDEFAI